MNDTRKKIVVNEILYWKKNRLLPEHYCDFLLALYTEGNDREDNERGNNTILSSKKSILGNPLYIAVMVLSIVGLVISEFTSFNFVFQGIILLMIVSSLIGITYIFSKKSLNYQVPLIASAFILLLFTVKMIEVLFPQQLLILYISLFIHCILWIVLGWKLKLIYFKIAGLFGGILILYFLGKFTGVL
ncbi:hypothetical protein [Peribacillus alkalitolerans]|uniref:hypothetical protein n=1 Tax=Peribacillus alkalitolerans TaxID=1550385 RepID=UPI0013D88903|nr:hypothetical protein [Peribacillus alkalitolerans]